jgi:hypothetical protein
VVRKRWVGDWEGEVVEIVWILAFHELVHELVCVVCCESGYRVVFSLELIVGKLELHSALRDITYPEF